MQNTPRTTNPNSDQPEHGFIGSVLTIMFMVACFVVGSGLIIGLYTLTGWPGIVMVAVLLALALFIGAAIG